jgi:hypothetical protein
MMVSLSGSPPVVAAQAAQAAAPSPAPSATQPDTVSISSQGRQMAAHSSDGDADAS